MMDVREVPNKNRYPSRRATAIDANLAAPSKPSGQKCTRARGWAVFNLSFFTIFSFHPANLARLGVSSPSSFVDCFAS
jgi:hypothetical protein